MATQFANGKTTTSGLVFMYDTTDKENCYKGEPTTNLAGPDFATWSVDTSGFSATGTRTILSTYHCRIEDSNTNTRHYKWIYGLSANTNYTFSVKFKKISGAPTLRFQISTFNGGTYINNNFPTTVQIGIADVDGWQTAIYSITTPAGTDRVVWFIQDGDDYTGYTHSFELKDVQLEQKSHVTLFTSSTRSATEGLKDLMVTNQIDISTVSFDATAQITFDGTNDTLDTGIALTELPALSNFSIECIVKIDSYPTAATPNGYGNTTKCGVLLGATYYSGTALYWYGNASGNACTIYAYIRGNDGYRTAGAYNLIPGQYHHLVLVNDYTNSSINLYANGVLNGTYAGPTQEYNPGLTPSAGNIGISKAQVDGGGTAVYSYFNGQIPVAKIYKKALTATEVTQNYNAIKTRFNLA